jgi:hypothetical protein
MVSNVFKQRQQKTFAPSGNSTPLFSVNFSPPSFYEKKKEKWSESLMRHPHST